MEYKNRELGIKIKVSEFMIYWSKGMLMIALEDMGIDTTNKTKEELALIFAKKEYEKDLLRVI